MLRFFAFFCALLCCGSSYALQAYHVGNSLTLGLDVNQLATWASLRGQTYAAGRHIQLGARLNEIWNNPSGNQFPIAPYGNFNNALPNYNWNVLTLEPYFDAASTTKSRIADFTQLAAGDPDVFVYQVWPWKLWGDYATHWNSNSTGNGDTSMFTRSFYNQLMGSLDSSIHMIPSGEVLYKVDALIKAGQLPNITSITQLYLDDNCTCHLNNIGNFALLSTVYSTLYQKSPVGLPISAGVSAEVGLILQQTAWDVVTGHPYSGVPEAGDFNRDGSVDATDYTVWRDGLGTLYTQADYNDWKANFGFTQGSGSVGAVGAAVPEPCGLLLILTSVALFAMRRNPRR